MTIEQLENERTVRQAELIETEKKLAEAKRAQNIDDWKKLRDNCRDTKNKLKELERDFARAEANVDRVGHEIDVVDTRLFVHRRTGPQPDEFPTDEQMKEFQQQEAELIASLKPLQEKRRDFIVAREQLRIQVVTLKREFERMEYAERNARALAAGEPLGQA